MKKYFILFLIPIFLFLFSSCSTDPDPDDDDDGVINGPLADLQADSAYKALELVLYDAINSGGNLDFSEPIRLYNAAYYNDKTDLDANFGSAFSLLLMITEDTDFLDTLEAFTTYFGNNPPFQAPLTKRGANSATSIFPSSIQMFNLPEISITQTIINTHRMALTDAPRLSKIQDLIETQFLEPINTARTRFDWVAAHAKAANPDDDWFFVISDSMQGDENLDAPLELDKTEVCAFDVSLSLLESIVNIILSYNVDFTSYDSLGLIETLSQDSDFLTARENGKFMGNAGRAIFNAIAKMEDGIEYLRDETDNQDNDLITLGLLGSTEDDLNDVLAGIEEARDFMNSDNIFSADWDLDPQTPEEDIIINLSTFFSSPILDLKALLPGYAITVGIDTTNWNYTYFNADSAISEWYYEPNGFSHTFYKSFYWYNNGNVDSSITTTLSLPGFNSALYNKIEELRQIPDTYYANVYISWSGYVISEYQINTYLRWSYQFRDPVYATYYPILTWDANVFSQWIFPDPTFNGMLPGMTDSEFKRIFGITGAGWQKTIDIFGNGNDR